MDVLTVVLGCVLLVFYLLILHGIYCNHEKLITLTKTKKYEHNTLAYILKCIKTEMICVAPA